MNKNDQKFFKPLWRRVAVLAFIAVWTIVEFSMGETMWAIMVAAIGAYGFWIFIIRFDEDESSEDADESGKGE